ncbi:hypothetical protein pneo_cds_876 [Pandoravirus neocaledonia]|uniref:Uncharacterized protein n=1 Tax=Pandoravirus neocaledonia TaxID=2107708 RepID=A0A2U7UDH0_9VIRU|nr:hypothetical protein pneo_cds_876 [Pandoravirus neocaledonia]AVK76483.1 hypothetical protein pneo_cds_876 [Pandoravirus neocaledonia]
MQHYNTPMPMANATSRDAVLPEEIPKSIVALFASVAVKQNVDLQGTPHPVTPEARMPIDEVARDTAHLDAVAVDVSTEAVPVDTQQLATIVSQAKAMSDASVNLIEVMRRTFGHAQVDRVCRDMQWSPPNAGASVAPPRSASSPAVHGADQTTTELRKFKIGALKTGQTNMVVGKRGIGKTTLLRHLLTAGGNRWDFVVGMTPTSESYDALVDMFPESCVHSDFDTEVIKRLIETLRALNDASIRPRVLLVLDDCVFDNRIYQSEPMRDLYKYARSLNIEFYNVVQYVMDVPKAMRSQVDRVFALREPQRAYRESLYRGFFDVFSTCDAFSTAFDACTENYGCMVIDSTAETNADEDCVFWYRGPADPPAVLLGSRAQWLVHHMLWRKPERPVFESALDVLMGALCPAPLRATDRVRLIDN